jgi:hypothetical protein
LEGIARHIARCSLNFDCFKKFFDPAAMLAFFDHSPKVFGLTGAMIVENLPWN